MENSSALKQALFADVTRSVYAILDGASVPDLLPLMDRHHPEVECVFRGELTPDVAAAAPYLIHLQVDSEFTELLITEGWGKHWGIFALSSSDMRGLRKHFRNLLTVYDLNGKPLLFRYYDPRVLRVYLPTCNAGELATVFGPVDSFIVEDDEGKGGLRFSRPSGDLKQQKF